jgi:hypothetical protein
MKGSASLELAYYKKGEAPPQWLKRKDAAAGWYM